MELRSPSSTRHSYISSMDPKSPCKCSGCGIHDIMLQHYWSQSIEEARELNTLQLEELETAHNRIAKLEHYITRLQDDLNRAHAQLADARMDMNELQGWILDTLARRLQQ